jgi:hypothetical protein
MHSKLQALRCIDLFIYLRQRKAGEGIRTLDFQLGKLTL